MSVDDTVSQEGPGPVAVRPVVLAPRHGRLRLPALRLRHKLGISLVVTALLPLLVASWVAVSVVLRSLNQGLHEQTDRQLRVGLALFLRNVEGVGTDAHHLSVDPGLVAAVEMGPQAVKNALVRLGRQLTPSLVQVTDATGAIVYQRVAGTAFGRFDGLEASPNSPIVLAGRRFEKRVAITRVGNQLVVRAAAPLFDESLQLRGVVVLSTPLDSALAERVKALLGADVLIFSAVEPGTHSTSTFTDPNGRPAESLILSPSVSAEIRRGSSVFRTTTVLDQDYAIGYAPIKTMAREIVGVFAVAVDRASLGSARAAATGSLALGAAGAFVFALGLAGLLSRRVTRPIANLHQGALAVARGDLDHQIEISVRDEIGDLAAAFSHMTSALKDNQRRLAARMREIVALHDAGRAVSSVLELDQVLRKIVDSIARVLHVRVCALWLVDGTAAEPGGAGPPLRLGAARAKRVDGRLISKRDDVDDLVQPLRAIARAVGESRAPLRIHSVVEDHGWRDAALSAGVTGSLVATPLERKGNVLGIIIIGRARDARAFSEADANLLATFADQAATAIENASLYSQVRSWSEELERKVDLRTSELTHMNKELGRTIQELKDTQAQLLLSERLAGLGHLVAAVAHEINSPSAAIRGAVDAAAEQMRRLTQLSHELANLGLSSTERDGFLALAGEVATQTASRRLPRPSVVRRAARELRAELEADRLPAEHAADSARLLAEMDLTPEEISRMRRLIATDGGERVGYRARVLIGYVAEYVHLHRGLFAIDHAIRRIQRIVGGLKSYSHLDQDASAQEVDVHEGIDDTLALLDHFLTRGIKINRRFGTIPRVPVYVDELNQVWTNLIHNAVQALDGLGEIVIETQAVEAGVAVRVIDNGPGIPEEVMPRMFEPLFTTKPRGEGSGLGLSIVRRILERHGGHIRVESQPGRTCFEVWLPLARGRARGSSEPGAAPGPEAA
jgi:signal transduction histidine kinase